MKIKSITLALSVLFTFAELSAQKHEKTTKITRQVDFVTQHLWRAKNSGTAPCIEPSIELKNDKFALGIWGAYAVDNSYQEIDLYLKYDTKHFQFSLYDFYCPRPKFENSKFFDFTGENSVHMFDAVVKYKASKSFPVSILASVIFAGELDKDAEGKQRYSSYLEFGYANQIGGKDFSYALGISPFKGMYDDKLNLVNASISMSDELKITDSFSVPIRGSLTLNPVTEKLFFTFMFTLR